VLAREGLAGYVDVFGHLWQDIDTPEDVERAESSWKMLAKSLVKESNSVVSRYINRSVSTAISPGSLHGRDIHTPKHSDTHSIRNGCASLSANLNCWRLI
jgi:NDP-sugar pyrophosphorylase family protein